MASHLSTRWQAQLLHSSCTATSPLSNEVWGLFLVSADSQRRTWRDFSCRSSRDQPSGHSFTQALPGQDPVLLPAAAPRQTPSHPLRSTAELPPPKAPVVLTAPVGLVVSPALLQVQETLLGLHTACLHKPFRCGIRCCRCVTLDMNVWPNGVTFHNNGAEAKSLF